MTADGVVDLFLLLHIVERCQQLDYFSKNKNVESSYSCVWVSKIRGSNHTIVKLEGPKIQLGDVND